jgi:hypothetical protein
MPRYEIVAHVARDLPCATPEDAAAVVRAHLMDGADGPVELLHLAVWREDEAATASPLSPSLRRKLVDFFAALDRSAADAEEAFRGRVAAILSAPGQRADG